MVPKADRLKDIEFSKIRLLNQKVEELQAEGREMCTFTIGQPDFPTPQYIKDACTKALNDGFTGYGSYTGSLNFRQAVVDKYKRETGRFISVKQCAISTKEKTALSFLLTR